MDVGADASTSPGDSRTAHWDDVYAGRAEDKVSWFEPEPTISLALLDAAGATPTGALIDAGAGASRLVDALVGPGVQ